MEGEKAMLEGFKKFSFLRGGTFVSISKNGINFNKNIVAKMQKARFVVLLINESQGQFAIQAAKDFVADSIPFFRREANLINGMRFYNRDVLQVLAKMMNWNLEKFIYRADGVYIEKEKAMIFDLNTARKFKSRGKDQL